MDHLVKSPDELQLLQMNLLSSSQHKKAVQRRSFEVILAIYEQLYEGVFNPKNLYEDPSSIFNKSPEVLKKTLLSL